MSAGLIVLIVLFAGLGISVWTKMTQDGEPAASATMDLVKAQFDGPLDAGLLKIARPLTGTRAIKDAARNPAFQMLREKVVSSGAYAADFEVYMAVQVASLFVGTGIILAAVGAGLSGLLLGGACTVGVAASFQPFSRVRSLSRSRGERVNEDLPVFVDLLLMPIASGMSPEGSLRFTIRYTTGPVAEEARWLLDTLASRTMTEEVAYREAGRRLGTPEAAAFFTALGQAHTEGAKVVDTLMKQADGLRIQAHQLRRVRIKKIPVKMVVAFALHFLPLLFLLAMIPLLVGLKNMGG